MCFGRDKSLTMHISFHMIISVMHTIVQAFTPVCSYTDCTTNYINGIYSVGWYKFMYGHVHFTNQTLFISFHYTHFGSLHSTQESFRHICLPHAYLCIHTFKTHNIQIITSSSTHINVWYIRNLW